MTNEFSKLPEAEKFALLFKDVNSRNPHLRRGSIEVIALVDDPRVPQVLLDALDDPSTVMQLQTLRAISSRADHFIDEGFDYTTKLSELIHHDDPEVRIQVGYALGKVIDERHIALITTLCSDPEPYVRNNALFALYNQAGIDAIDVLIDHLDDDSAWWASSLFGTHVVSTAAKWAIRQFGEDARLALTRALRHKRAGVRAAAAELIRELDAGEPHHP